MKKKHNIKLSIFIHLIVIITLFMGIGYASINSVALDIKGTSNAKSQDDIYITEVNTTSTSTSTSLSNVSNNGTLLTSKIALENDKDSTISIQVVLYNSTNSNYIFDEIVYTEEKYNNTDITFSFNKKDEILKSGETLEVTVTFKYDTYNSQTSNILESMLNFKFIKLYNVTYENFNSTTSYPTYIGEDKTLTISFGTLDAPIEVYKDNVLLTSSQYSYSNYVLTIPNVNGNIHVRKYGKYTITNMVTNGSFENDFTGWNIFGNSSYWSTPNISIFGSKSGSRKSSGAQGNFLLQPLNWQEGHKYYWYFFAIALSDQRMLADITNKGGAIDFTAMPDVWNRGSAIYTSDFTGTNTISVNFAETSNYTYVDGVTVIDLTTAFGSGNEPTKAWCDTNIRNWFEGSTIVYK